MEQSGRREPPPAPTGNATQRGAGGSSPTSKPLRQLHSHSSSSGHEAGLLNPPPIRKRGRNGSQELENSSRDPSPEPARVGRGGSFRARAPQFPNRYEYEWHEPSFFDHNQQQDGQPAAPPSDAHLLPTGQAPGPPGVGKRPHQTVQVNAVKTKMDGNIMLIEVANGAHQLVEVSPSEILHRVRYHRYSPDSPAVTGMSSFSRAASLVSHHAKQGLGDLTYRDIRQVFTEGDASASIEVRRNCIVLCLRPITAIIMHDRCVFMVNDGLDYDSLLVKLEDITAQYAKTAETTRQYYVNLDAEQARNSASPPDPTSPQAPQALPAEMPGQIGSRNNMLFGVSSTGRALGAEEEKNAKVPRFVSFPLEFAILEVLLGTAFEMLQAELAAMEETLDRVERRVTKNSPSSTRLEVLHSIKSPCQLYSDAVRSVSVAFRDLLGHPEDVKFMQLTKFFYRPDLYSEAEVADEAPNADLEILLEFYDQEVNQFERRVRAVLRSIDNAEKLLSLRMMLTRNSLVYYELAGTVLTTFLNVGTCISGIFGMNLINGGEDSHIAFLWTTGCITIVVILGIVVVTWMVAANKM